MRLRLPLMLLACGGLGWLALAGEGGPGGLPEPIGLTEAPPPRPASPSPPGPAAGPWPEQVARPLFAATRRPPEPPPEPVPLAMAEPEPPPPAAASGVVLRPEGAVALLRLADDRTARVVEGEEIEGWRVARIFAEGVDLTRGEQRLTLPARAPAAEGLARGE